MTVQRLTHRFVTSVPAKLERGVLYVSIEYDTTLHLCACGCGNQVVLPLHPTAWQFIYDGESVSMSPSVGNWGFPCRSHYWIERGRVRWAPAWTDAQVNAGRQRTLRERGITPVEETKTTPPRRTLWQRIRDTGRRLFGRE